MRSALARRSEHDVVQRSGDGNRDVVMFGVSTDESIRGEPEQHHGNGHGGDPPSARQPRCGVLTAAGFAAVRRGGYATGSTTATNR